MVNDAASETTIKINPNTNKGNSVRIREKIFDAVGVTDRSGCLSYVAVVLLDETEAASSVIPSSSSSGVVSTVGIVASMTTSSSFFIVSFSFCVIVIAIPVSWSQMYYCIEYVSYFYRITDSILILCEKNEKFEIGNDKLIDDFWEIIQSVIGSQYLNRCTNCNNE